MGFPFRVMVTLTTFSPASTKRSKGTRRYAGFIRDVV